MAVVFQSVNPAIRQDDSSGAIEALRGMIRARNETQSPASKTIALTEKEIQTVTANYQHLFNLAPVAYFAVFEDMMIKEVNQAGSSMLNIDRLDLLGNPLVIYVQPEWRDQLRNHYRDVFRGRENEIELVFEKSEGESFPARIHSVLIRDSDSAVPCCLSTVIDLSDQQVVRQEFHTRHNRLHSLHQEQSRKIGETQDRLLEETTHHRRVIQDAPAHNPIRESDNREIHRLRNELDTQKNQKDLTQQELIRLQEHLTRLTHEQQRESRQFREKLTTQITEKTRLQAELQNRQEQRLFSEAETSGRLHDHIEILEDRLAQQSALDYARRRQLEQTREFLKKRIQRLCITEERLRKTTAEKDRLILHLTAQCRRLDELREEKQTHDNDGAYRRQIDLSLQRTENLLEKTCRLNRIASWRYDVSCHRWIHSAGLDGLLGYPADSNEPTAQAFRTAIHPDDRKAVERFLLAPPDGQNRIVLEHRILKPSGKIRFVRHTIEILRDDSGRPVHLAASMQDITGSRKIEQHLVKRSRQLDQIGRDQVEWLKEQKEHLLQHQARQQILLDDASRRKALLEERVEIQNQELAASRLQRQAEISKQQQMLRQFRKHRARLVQRIRQRSRRSEDIRRTLEIGLQQRQSLIDELSEQRQQLQVLVDQKQDQVCRIQTQQADQEKSIAELTHQRDRLRESLSEQLGQLAEVNPKLRELSQVRDHLIAELNRAREQLQQQTQTHAEAIQKLQLQLRDRDEQSIQSCMQLTAQIQELETRLTREIEDQEFLQQRLDDERGNHKADIDELSAQLHLVQDELDARHRRFAQREIELIRERETLQSQLMEAKARGEEASRLIDDLRRDYSATSSAAKDQILQLQEELSRNRESLETAQDEIRQQSTARQAAERQWKQYGDRLQNDLNEARDHIARLQEQLQTRPIADADSQFETMRSALDESHDDFNRFVEIISHDLDATLSKLDFVFRGINESIVGGSPNSLPDIAERLRVQLAFLDELQIAVSHLSIARRPYPLESIDMRSLIGVELDQCRNWIEQVGAEIRMGDIPPCHAAREPLACVVSHVIGNALKFLDPARPGQIEITGWIDDGECVYCIADNGIGMAPDQIDQAFRLFVQLNPNTPGRGMGLAVVRQILAANHGRIEVRSESGRGTQILFTLPAVR